MKYQMIMARTLPEEVTQGTLEGDIVPGEITFYRLQSTADCKLRAYIAQGEVLPVATKSFGGIGVFAISEMGRFYRHVLIEKNYPHHGAVAFGHFGKALYEVFKYIGVPVEDLNFNQPKGMMIQIRQESVCIRSHKSIHKRLLCAAPDYNRRSFRRTGCIRRSWECLWALQCGRKCGCCSRFLNRKQSGRKVSDRHP